MKRIAVFGTGYVGCVTAACLSRDGFHTVGVDIDSGKVAALNAGESPVAEPGLSELVSQQVAAGRLSATEDFREAIAETDIAMIAVGTPSDRAGAVSTDALEKVVASIGQSLKEKSHPYTVVIRSTLLPGILENRLTPLLAETSNAAIGEEIHICTRKCCATGLRCTTICGCWCIVCQSGRGGVEPVSGNCSGKNRD